MTINRLSDWTPQSWQDRPATQQPAYLANGLRLRGYRFASAVKPGEKVFVQAGDYRRAVEACQRHIDQHPAVEAYVYLAYVYQAIDGYLAALVKQEDYVKVEQLSLNLTAREVIDIIDPPNVMPRMAQELIHEGLRQQFDIASAMGNRLNRVRTNELWLQQSSSA